MCQPFIAKHHGRLDACADLDGRDRQWLGGAMELVTGGARAFETRGVGAMRDVQTGKCGWPERTGDKYSVVAQTDRCHSGRMGMQE